MGKAAPTGTDTGLGLMPSQAAPKQNSTADITPAPIEWRVKTVEVQQHLSLLVTFNDNRQGIVSISPEWLTGVFSDLNDAEMFRTAFVEHGAVTWSNGLDLDPKTMYDAIKANGNYRIK